MNAFPWVLNGVVEAWVSAGRICRLFEGDDVTVYSINPAFNADDTPREQSQIQGNSELVLKSPLFYWESVDSPALTDLNVTITMVSCANFFVPKTIIFRVSLLVLSDP